MGYAHIQNLYAFQRILQQPRIVAMEKIHGTSAHVSKGDGGVVTFSGGGETQHRFLTCFDVPALQAALAACPYEHVTIYGEAYGGSQQRMAHVYGPKLRFVAFDVKANGVWMDVEDAEEFVKSLGLDFVPYKIISNDLAEIDAERDAPSEQARKNGVEGDQPREGVVLKCLREYVDEDGERVMAKHKQDRLAEMATPRKVVDPAQQVVLDDAVAIAKEWVVLNRLEHVMGALLRTRHEAGNEAPLGIQDTGTVCAAMVEDVIREAGREIVVSKEAKTAISKRASLLYREHLKQQAFGESV